MKLIPISLPITMTMVVYKDLAEKRPIIETTRDFHNHGICENTLHLPLHTGTHVDYPLHAIAGGKSSSDYQIFPTAFKGYVLDLTLNPVSSIGVDQLQALDFDGIEAVFFKTLSAPLEAFDFEFPWLNGEAAAWLSQTALKFVGTDQPGIERMQPNHETHIRLLQKDILIVEGLDLSALHEGIYEFQAHTLQIKGVEAEPLMIYALEE